MHKVLKRFTELWLNKFRDAVAKKLVKIYSYGCHGLARFIRFVNIFSSISISIINYQRFSTFQLQPIINFFCSCSKNQKCKFGFREMLIEHKSRKNSVFYTEHFSWNSFRWTYFFCYTLSMFLKDIFEILNRFFCYEFFFSIFHS